MSTIVLGDDGTMDTVLVCTECGKEFRYNFNPSPDSEETYDEFVEWAIKDAESDHDCNGEEESNNGA